MQAVLSCLLFSIGALADADIVADSSKLGPKFDGVGGVSGGGGGSRLL